MRQVLILVCLAALALSGWAAVGAQPGAEGRSGTGAAAGGSRPAAITLDYDADGRLSASGVLPSDLPRRTFTAMLPGVDAAGVRQGGAAAADGWERAVEGLSIVLPRFASARARLTERRLAITGELQPGFSAEGTRAALTAALSRGWRITLEATEAAPLAEVILSKAPDGLTASGLVPAGLEPSEALRLLGGDAGGDGLAGGGAGDAAAWSRTVAATGEALGLFRTARAVIEEGAVELAGVLRPGYPAAAVARRLSAGVPSGWRANVEAAETPPGEGDRRVSLATGETELYRSGFWLPELDFTVSPARCEAEADAALGDGEVPFLAGSAEIDPAGLPLIDRLAAIAVRCLNSSEMRLEIAGHTDSVGNDSANLALSEARANAVVGALLARGVRAGALTASGHGESQPVATNNTPEGRARNRRIAFNWSEG